MIPFKERRRQPRRMGEGLGVAINGRFFPVVDISVSGVCFQGTGYAPGDRISATLAHITQPADAVSVVITVKAAGNSTVRGEFYPTNKLMRFILAHVGEVTGTSPNYFK